MKKALRYGSTSFILIYASCILLGTPTTDLTNAIFQNLFWSLPAAIIIGLVTYFGFGKYQETSD